MVTTLDDTKRKAIAAKLSDMKLIQELFLENEELFLKESTDGEISQTLRKMNEDDRKNLDILNTVMVQYGVSQEPEAIIEELVENTRELMQSAELTFYEKVFQHELLKHQQVMNGLTIHKAGQKIGTVVMTAIGPLNTINFENRAHQEQLKGILEILGVRELTGQDADQGIWARVQDAISAITGVVGSAVTQTSDQSIQDILRTDHNYVNTLFTELLKSNNTEEIQGYFTQINQNLTIHALAEEEVVYPRVRPFYGEASTQSLFDEQTHMKLLLEQIQSLNHTAKEFKEMIRQLMNKVSEHISQEESSLFTAIRNHMTDRESTALATEFKSAKTKFQKILAGGKTQVNA